MLNASYRSTPDSPFWGDLLSDYLPLGKNLFPYQVAAVAYFMATKKGMLCPLKPGAGKTPIAAAIAHLHVRTVVVAPPTILQQWVARLREWGHHAISVVRTQQEARNTKRIPEGVTVVTDSVIACFRPLPCDLLVVDESHRFKNRAARRSRRVLGKGGWATHAGKVLLLSGSPAPNGVCDLFTTCHALGMPVGEAWATYAERYCPDQLVRFGDRTRVKNDKGQHIDELNHLLRNGYMHKPKDEEVMSQLPPLRVESLALTAHETSLSEDTIIQGFQGKLTGEAEAQFSTQRRILGEVKGKLAAEHLAMLLEGGERPLIWVWHRSVGQQLALELKVPFISGELPQAARALILARYIKREIPAIILSIAAAGTGLDGLQHAGEFAVFVERDYVPASNEQAIARLHRTGQKRPVRILNLTSHDPMDRALERILRRKSAESEQVQA